MKHLKTAKQPLGETPADSTGGVGMLTGLFAKLLRIVCGVPLLTLFAVGVLGVVFSVTWNGRFVAFGTVLFAVVLFCTIGYWSQEWFRRIRRRFYGILLSACALLILLPILFGPDGGALEERVHSRYLGGDATFARFAPWNIVPEEDQVSVVIAVSIVADKHVDSTTASRIRSLTMPVYQEIKNEVGFQSLGSALGAAYCELFQMEFRSGHYYVFLPESKPEQRLPCIVFLHGMGGNRKSNFWAITKIATEMKCVVIAPTFGLGNWEKEGGAEQVVAITREAIAALPIDRGRVFLMGYSNGAKGVTRAVIEAPTLYRGLIFLSPVTEDRFFSSPEFLQQHKTRKTLFLHGDNDSRIPLEFVEHSVESLNQLGGTTRLRLYPGEDHYLILSQRDSIAKEIAEFMKDEPR